MPTVLRRLLPVVFATLLLAALAPGAMAATTHAFPNQSLGNRGSDVRAIEGLLRAHGLAAANDGHSNVFSISSPRRDQPGSAASAAATSSSDSFGVRAMRPIQLQRSP